MRYLRATVIVILVFGLPIGSYLYLRSGFIYRKDALEELKAKTPLSPEQYNLLTSKDSRIVDRFHSGVTVFQNIEEESDIDDAEFFAESFGTRADYSLVTFVPSRMTDFLSDTTYSKTLSKIPKSTDLSGFFGDSRFLLARDSFVRKGYGVTKEEKAKLQAHTAIMLPMKGKDKVELRRNTDQ